MLAATAQPGLRLEVCRDFMKVRDAANPRAIPREAREPAPPAAPVAVARGFRAGVSRGQTASGHRKIRHRGAPPLPARPRPLGTD